MIYMLNLKIAMRPQVILPPLIIILVIPLFIAQAQEITVTPNDQITFISPDPGQAIQGTILILARFDNSTITNARLEFAYQDDPRNTWFHIQDFQDASQGELEFEWDTTTLTDGDYTLRLSTSLGQGEQSSTSINIRVRNYTAVETSTPGPTTTIAPGVTGTPTITPTRSITAIPSTSTALPPNPVQITSDEIRTSIIVGSLLALFFLSLLGIYQYLRTRKD